MSLYHLIVLLFLFFVFFIMLMIVSFFIFFFFSSRRRHTRFDCDWSSDVCSSDLVRLRPCFSPLPRTPVSGLLHSIPLPSSSQAGPCCSCPSASAPDLWFGRLGPLVPWRWPLAGFQL